MKARCRHRPPLVSRLFAWRSHRDADRRQTCWKFAIKCVECPVVDVAKSSPLEVASLPSRHLASPLDTDTITAAAAARIGTESVAKWFSRTASICWQCCHQTIGRQQGDFWRHSAPAAGIRAFSSLAAVDWCSALNSTDRCVRICPPLVTRAHERSASTL